MKPRGVRPPSLGVVLLFAPLAAAAAYVAFIGTAAVIAGVGAGGADVALTSDSGGPGWFIALLGVLALIGVCLFAWAGWIVAADRATVPTLVVVALVCAPALLLWLTGVAAGGLDGLASVLGVAPYLLVVTLWRLRRRWRGRRTGDDPRATRTSHET